MAERGITGDVAEEIFHKMKAFANYGFPESHSVCFAYLVYASSWIKYHEPAAFCAALINAQPMGFWSPHTLVQDARRHGVDRADPRPQRVARGGHPRRRRRSRCGSGDRLGAWRRRRAGRADRGANARDARPLRLTGRPRPAGPRPHRWPTSRRWRPPACSASASGSSVARHCGRPERCRSRGPGGSRASSRANGRPPCRA